MGLKDNVFYVYDRFDPADVDYVFAKYSPEYDCFYCFKYDNAYDCEELYNLVVGQKVIHQYGGWDVFDETVDEDVANKARIHKMQRLELKKKHPDLWPVVEDPPKTRDLIREYFKNKVVNGEDIDFYVVGIVELLSKPMDIRVRRRHGGSLYTQLGLDYPEDVFDTIGALYSIISQKLKSLGVDEHILFLFNEFSMSDRAKTYNELCDELDKRTGFRFDSEVHNRLRSVEYHDSMMSDRYKELSRQKPAIYILKDSTIYYSDMDGNGIVQEITPEICKDMYSDIIESTDIKVFQKKKSEQN